ncbi:hypothetical protein HDV05_006817 [Chytridiales sp. JEL 0842]|nr:hypothetical protein HDV05_006817 [Chytridiales sp. JEL 0842]
MALLSATTRMNMDALFRTSTVSEILQDFNRKLMNDKPVESAASLNIRIAEFYCFVIVICHNCSASYTFVEKILMIAQSQKLANIQQGLERLIVLALRFRRLLHFAGPFILPKINLPKWAPVTVESIQNASTELYNYLSKLYQQAQANTPIRQGLQSARSETSFGGREMVQLFATLLHHGYSPSGLGTFAVVAQNVQRTVAPYPVAAGQMSPQHAPKLNQQMQGNANVNIEIDNFEDVLPIQQERKRNRQHINERHMDSIRPTSAKRPRRGATSSTPDICSATSASPPKLVKEPTEQSPTLDVVCNRRLTQNPSKLALQVDPPKVPVDDIPAAAEADRLVDHIPYSNSPRQVETIQESTLSSKNATVSAETQTESRNALTSDKSYEQIVRELLHSLIATEVYLEFDDVAKARGQVESLLRLVRGIAQQFGGL